MSSTNPLSEKRLAANRANAQKSTGPRTPEGKAASSRNAVKHGFRSSSFTVVRLEDLDEVANLKADAVAFYNPANSQELIAVERIALAQQMIFRAARLEAGLFTDAMNLAVDRLDNPIKPMDEMLIGTGDIEICKSQNRNYALGEGVRRMARESNVWSIMLRYRAQADREYRRALEDFERLKVLRAERKGDHSGRRFARLNEDPNEPNELAQTEHPPEVIPPHELNCSIPREPQKQIEPASEPAVAAKPAPETPKPLKTTPNSQREPRPKAA